MYINIKCTACKALCKIRSSYILVRTVKLACLMNTQTNTRGCLHF